MNQEKLNQPDIAIKICNQTTIIIIMYANGYIAKEGLSVCVCMFERKTEKMKRIIMATNVK